jgi:hypothetical protein
MALSLDTLQAWQDTLLSWCCIGDMRGDLPPVPWHTLGDGLVLHKRLFFW